MEIKKYVPIILILSIILISGCIQEGGQQPSTSTGQPPVPSCTPNWQCTEWSTCTATLMGGIQTRTCTDVNNCNSLTGKPVESQSCTPIRLATKEPSEMALNLSDMLGNWTISERTERIKSDVSSDAVALGWQRGYYVRLYKTAGTLLETTVVEDALSVYPKENISKVLSIPYNKTGTVEYLGANYSFIIEDLSDPDIGDDSKAYRYTLTDSYGNTLRYYEIEFVKLNVYHDLMMSGINTDYELLKELAKKAEAKIG